MTEPADSSLPLLPSNAIPLGRQGIIVDEKNVNCNKFCHLLDDFGPQYVKCRSGDQRKALRQSILTCLEKDGLVFKLKKKGAWVDPVEDAHTILTTALFGWQQQSQTQKEAPATTAAAFRRRASQQKDNQRMTTPPSCRKRTVSPPPPPPPPASSSNKKAKTTTINTDSITDNDVLFGAGRAISNFIGNKRFRSIVADVRQDYLHASDGMEKAAVARRVVATVQKVGGRFLKRVKMGSWTEVADDLSQDKAYHAIRTSLKGEAKKETTQSLQDASGTIMTMAPANRAVSTDGSSDDDDEDDEEGEGDELYMVERILEIKRVGNRVKCLIKWQGYDEVTWEPMSNLNSRLKADAQAMLEKLEEHEDDDEEEEEEEGNNDTTPSPDSGDDATLKAATENAEQEIEATTEGAEEDEMDVAAVEATAAYGKWMTLPYSTDFLYKGAYYNKGRKGDNLMLREMIWSVIRRDHEGPGNPAATEQDRQDDVNVSKSTTENDGHDEEKEEEENNYGALLGLPEEEADDSSPAEPSQNAAQTSEAGAKMPFHPPGDTPRVEVRTPLLGSEVAATQDAQANKQSDALQEPSSENESAKSSERGDHHHHHQEMAKLRDTLTLLQASNEKLGREKTKVEEENKKQAEASQAANDKLKAVVEKLRQNKAKVEEKNKKQAKASQATNDKLKSDIETLRREKGLAEEQMEAMLAAKQLPQLAEELHTLNKELCQIVENNRQRDKPNEEVDRIAHLHEAMRHNAREEYLIAIYSNPVERSNVMKNFRRDMQAKHEQEMKKQEKIHKREVLGLERKIANLEYKYEEQSRNHANTYQDLKHQEKKTNHHANMRRMADRRRCAVESQIDELTAKNTQLAQEIRRLRGDDEGPSVEEQE